MKIQDFILYYNHRHYHITTDIIILLALVNVILQKLIYFRIVDYLMEQLSLWETALRDIPDATTQIITEHK